MSKTVKTIIVIVALAVVIGVVAALAGNNKKEATPQTTAAPATTQTTTKESFNGFYKSYDGKTIGGPQASLLWHLIESSNKKNTDHQITIEGAKEASSINSKSKYKITVKEGSDGYVNQVTIKEVK